MILFVSDTCPRCVPIKRMAGPSVKILNITKQPALIEQYGLITVPAVLTEDGIITDIQTIIQKVRN
jgi:hypothetical protein